MTPAFIACWKKLVGIEGDFSDAPNDPGGKTRFGITERLARSYGYAGSMRDLPPDLACSIAEREFWIPLRLDDVSAIAGQRVAYEILDTGYNMGRESAAGMLQQALNAFNRQAVDYPDVTVDCKIGPLTLDALRGYIAKRGGPSDDGAKVLLRALNCLQGASYIRIGIDRPASEDFMFGWFRLRVDL